MKKILLAGSVAGVLSLAAPVLAFAWATDPSGNLVATNSAEQTIYNRIVQQQQQAQQQLAIARGGRGGAGGAGGNSASSSNSAVNNVINGNGSGNSWPVSSAIAPGFGVAGPCTGQAASAAGSFPVFSLSFGGTDLDEACRAGHIGNMTSIGDKIAFEVLCGKREDRAAIQRAAARWGTPACQADTVPVSAPAPAPSKPAGPPDWCVGAGHWTSAERRQHPECM